MGEKKYNYTTKVNEPQKVAGITLNKEAGVITERQLKALKKDPYGASLLEKGLLIIGEEVTSDAPAPVPAGTTEGAAATESEVIPTFENPAE